ncbi:hypothetical protein [Rhizobium sp. BK176]|uniref:hypothetical protein n=1 Tax=Rhizobium sp. BK176 TaxID=2587071 RepID=UPI00216AAD88|nr:hypothetical protein [Rhizobium sp. BK176]MCS4089801.1 hypothetical protein [Rhizobium sp. BK176]
MNDIAKTMAERIRNAAGGATVMAPTGNAARRLAEVTAPQAPADGLGSIDARQEYILNAAQQFERHYGVQLDTVMGLFVPKNDMLYAAAEENVPLDEFIKTVGTQMSFDPIVGKEPDYAKYVAGENRVKLALAEFAYSDEDWTLSDGYAVAENDDAAVVIAPFYDETIHSWQFSAYTAPCDKDTFVSMSRAQKASVPSEDREYGDIDDCVRSMFQVKAAPAAMRM